MILAETLVFALALLDYGCILFLLVYYVITLSDLDCDYLNPRDCCDELNYWILPKYIGHIFVSFLLLIHGYIYLFLLTLPMLIYLTYEYFFIPKGNCGVFDPAEIFNGRQLNKCLRHCLIHIGYYLIVFFIFLYCFIIALLKGDPINRHHSDTIVTEI